MNCPVCQKAGVPDNSLVCPQCDSDLSQYQLLGKINKRNTVQKRIIVILSFSLLVPILLILIFWRQVIKIGPKSDIFVTQSIAKDSILYYKNKWIEEIRKIDSLNELHKICFTLYEIKKDDNLSKIAIMFYGNDERVDEIAKENSIVNPDIIFDGQTLRIRILK